MDFGSSSIPTKATRASLPTSMLRNADGEAKFWLRPNVRHARSRGLDFRALRKLAILIEARRDEIEDAWNGHFS
jgi:hypothetical protein